MSRIRTIKPEFFKHEELFDAEMESGLPLRLAFAGLWTQCDREGRFVWRPRQLKVDILPYDDLDFSRVLDALATRGFVRKYRAENRDFGFIPSWHRHQIVNNRETASSLPRPTEKIEETDASGTREPRDGHAGKAEGKGKEGKGRAPNGALSETSSDAPPKKPKKITYTEAFEAFWKSYPTTPNMSKFKTASAWAKMTPEDQAACSASVPGYLAFLKSKPDHPVMHATTFINERRFEGFVAVSAAAPREASEADWQKRLGYARQHRKWFAVWGPVPGQTGCLAPVALLVEGDGQDWELEGFAA